MSKRSNLRRIRDWWIDCQCEFVAAHGRWWLIRSREQFCVLKHRGDPPLPDGWFIVSNFMTRRAASRYIDTERWWDNLMGYLGPSICAKLAESPGSTTGKGAGDGA